MIARGFDRDRVERLTREGLDACRGCHVDITIKDHQTLGGDFQNLVDWTKTVKTIAEEYA